MTKKIDETYSDKETERRFTAALGRALTTPHKPQKAKSNPAKKVKKPSK